VDEPLASVTGLGAAFFEADGLGSITSLSGAAGVTDTYTYKPFGVTTATGSNPNRFRFTGREWDSETNLYYYRARYYDPNTGRFLSEDPTAFGGGMNFFAYGHNSPTNLVDPYGLKDSASPWQVGWEWLTGSGPHAHFFTDGDPFTEKLRNHEHIQELINDVCNGTLPSSGSFNYRLNGVQGVPKYLRDYSTLFTGGLTGNIAVTYLGTYGLDYSVTNGTLNIHIWNISAISSATHPPVLGYKGWWKNNIGDPLDRLIESGPLGEPFGRAPMSQTYQSLDFHEDLSNRCGCSAK
jgi:RHS repeat-associated protein